MHQTGRATTSNLLSFRPEWSHRSAVVFVVPINLSSPWGLAEGRVHMGPKAASLCPENTALAWISNPIELKCNQVIWGQQTEEIRIRVRLTHYRQPTSEQVVGNSRSRPDVPPKDKSHLPASPVPFCKLCLTWCAVSSMRHTSLLGVVVRPATERAAEWGSLLRSGDGSQRQSALRN